MHCRTYRLCRVSCPAYRVPAELMVKHEQLVFAALAALRPVAPLQEAVHSAQQQLQQAGRAGKAYTVVHLKAEDAWIAQCATWAATGMCLAGLSCNKLAGSLMRAHPWVQQSKRPRCGHHPACLPPGVDNCLNNTDTVGEQLALHNVDKQASGGRCPAAWPARIVSSQWKLPCVAEPGTFDRHLA